MVNRVGRDLMRVLLVVAAAPSALVFGGLVTSATATVYSAVPSPSCSVAGSSLSACDSSSIGSEAASQAAASYGFVQAWVAGSATGHSDASGSATAAFTDTVTIYGGSGQGMLVETLQLTQVGTGVLQSFVSAAPQTVTAYQPFTFGTAFTFSESISAYGSFFGTWCDAGSLLVSKQLVSMSVSDGSSNGGLTFSDGSNTKYTFTNASFSPASVPEPAAWILMVIGLILVAVFATARRLRRD